MPSKDLDALKESQVDIYALLSLPSSASDNEIRRAYRKQALLFHPDKNPSAEAADPFHQLTLALNVLSDKTLRAEYDAWMSAREMERVRSAKMGEERKRMKEELQTAERESGFGKRKSQKTDVYASDLERLRREGAEKRAKFEEEYLKKLHVEKKVNEETHVTKVDDKSSRTVRVKWKVKEGITDLFTGDVLEGIMSVFGDVESCEILSRKSGSRYDTAAVTFRNYASAVKAVEHDYGKKSSVWDSTSYRKLSGLISEVRWDREQKTLSSKGILNKDTMSFNEYLDATVQKLKNMKREH